MAGLGGNHGVIGRAAAREQDRRGRAVPLAAGAWGDLWRAWPPLLAYGLALAAFSLWISLSFVATGGAFWVFALTCGFVFVAPMLAMGLYEAGSLLARGERRPSHACCSCPGRCRPTSPSWAWPC
uniref:DUF2189 domain-containing protein n=1 Tax=Phenylobacterium glaciei TaxID=2803784 RepID=A0A974S931_9CAUL|nr:DUF2189 domain-containing protein [Phenylobacterium glaciei]